MPDLVDVVALSLLPTWCWLTAGDLLRAGEPSADVLRQLCGHHWRDRPDYIAELRAQATTAVRRGVERGLTPGAWGEAAYPIAPTTIPDPPPVLWTRGGAANLIAPQAPAGAP